nr:MAG TPA: hypothetical protein [Caudoviricetes sp.]
MQWRLIIALHLDNRIRPAFRPCDGTDTNQTNRPCDGTSLMVYCRLDVRKTWTFHKGMMFPLGEVRLYASGDRVCIACQQWKKVCVQYVVIRTSNYLVVRVQPFEEHYTKSNGAVAPGNRRCSIPSLQG